jgi:putative hydrolase of the HAD superfamily
MRGGVARPKLVVFDAFNTLVRPVAGSEGTFVEALAELGVAASPEAMRRLQAASAGIDHRRWSRSRDDYAGWTHRTLGRAGPDLLRQYASDVIPALEQWHQAPMEQFADVTACLSALTSAGVIVAICSNWGWDLTHDLDGAAVTGLADIVVSSAEAGCRKPHPEIYSRVLKLAGVRPAEAVFVGDNIEADVRGPRRVGMASILLDRTGSGASRYVSIPSLADLAARIRL